MNEFNSYVPGPHMTKNELYYINAEGKVKTHQFTEEEKEGFRVFAQLYPEMCKDYGIFIDK